VKQIKEILLSKLPENNRFERIWKLAQVDFRKNFYNDKLGLFWALLNPVMRLLVYYFAFTFLMERVREGIPNFALFLFSALIFWMEFTKTMKRGMKLLYQKRYLIENIKVNKIDLFISLGLASLIAFSFNLLAYLIIALILGNSFNINLIFLPVLVLNLYLISLGTGMILSILYIYFKDINHLLDILILFGFWTSGVIFPTESIIDKFAFLYYINPFMGMFTNVREILVYGGDLNFVILNINLLTGILLYIIGVSTINKFSHRAFEYI